MARTGELGERPSREIHPGPLSWGPHGQDQLFRLLVSAVRDHAIFALDLDGTVLTWNTGAERLYGYGESEMVGAHFSKLFSAEDLARRHPQEELERAAGTGRFEEEGWRVRKDGSRFWAGVAIARMEDPSGRLLGFAKVTRDLTEKRRAALEEQLHLLADSIPQLAWIADETGWIFWYNRRWYEYTGTTPEQMEGWGWQSVHDPRELPRVLERFKGALLSGEPWEDTFPLRSHTGEWRWFLSRAVPIRNADGQIFRWFGTNTDVTAQVELARQRDRLLQDVQFERARFEAVMSQMPAAVIIGEAPSGKLVFANSLHRAVWGHDLIASQSIEEYALWRGFHPDGRPYRPEEWPLARAIQKGEVVDCEEADVVWPTGERRTLRLSASPVRGADGTILAGVVICQDVTAEKAAHTSLADSEARFRSILENSPAIIFMKDAEGRYIVSNPALTQVLGRQQALLLGRTDFDLFPKEVAEQLRQTDAEIRRSRVSQQREEVVDGRVFLTVKFPVVGEDGSVRFVGGISTDISDRKQTEAKLRSLTEDLERQVTQRTQELVVANKELEAFSYSVSHDLRAPLRAIDGFSKALVEDHRGALDADARELLADVRQAAQRMATLIDDLLRLSRVTRAPLTRARVDLSALAQAVVGELRRQDPTRAVETHIQAGLVVEGDEPLLRIALENLLANAWKFTGRQPAPVIELGVESVEGERAFFVRDNGAGFDMAYAGKLFVTFQRLHATSEFPGTGIGLATVQRVVHRHGGRAWAVGEPGHGATFYFTLAEGRAR
ncbi:MAG TPA: PAS domain S-box protein [Polyangia bacterium]|nr:PAS domain S-box protein [Polyangia bacterium]